MRRLVVFVLIAAMAIGRLFAARHSRGAAASTRRPRSPR